LAPVELECTRAPVGGEEGLRMAVLGEALQGVRKQRLSPAPAVVPLYRRTRPRWSRSGGLRRRTPEPRARLRRRGRSLPRGTSGPPRQSHVTDREAGSPTSRDGSPRCAEDPPPLRDGLSARSFRATAAGQRRGLERGFACHDRWPSGRLTSASCRWLAPRANPRDTSADTTMPSLTASRSAKRRSPCACWI
jgi:hypothetical protein